MAPHLEKLQREIGSAVEGFSADQMSYHPSGKWSVAEILEHLYLTYTGTLKGLSRSVASGTSSVSKPTWKNRVQSLAVLKFGYLPTGREAPQFARPNGLPSSTILSQIRSKIEEMDGVLEEYEAKLGVRTKLLNHVFLGPLSANEWRKFHLVHGLHHVKQIRKLRLGLAVRQRPRTPGNQSE